MRRAGGARQDEQAKEDGGEEKKGANVVASALSGMRYLIRILPPPLSSFTHA